jgi:hypothetical protein
MYHLVGFYKNELTSVEQKQFIPHLLCDAPC